MSDAVARWNTALEGRYAIERLMEVAGERKRRGNGTCRGARSV